ncbi:MAG: polyphenol oxidase family protein [Acidimicrobiia bacterium]
MNWTAREIGRARIVFASAAAGSAPADPVLVRQVHGAAVVDAATVGAERPEADALVTDRVGVVCAIRTADCAPVALVVGDGAAVGLAHAGWRGLRDGVIQATVHALRARHEAPIHAVLGPCIRVEHYEFGEPDLSSMVERYGAQLRGRTTAGAPALDVVAGVRAALREVGVTELDDVVIDTYASPAHHSWRRDHDDARNVTYAWIDPENISEVES